MTDRLTFAGLLRDTLKGAARVIVPSLPWTALFVFAWGYLVWAAAALPESAMSTALFAGLALLTLYAHSLFSVSIYRVLLGGEATMRSAAFKLTLSWLLVFTVMAIIFSIWTLFFSMVGASVGIVSGQGDAGQISDITELMQQGGTFWPLFIVFIASFFALFWFVARLMTFAAATSHRAQVHVFRTWAWTKGQFRRLGPALFGLVFLPLAAGSVVGVFAGQAIWGNEPTAIEAALAAGLTMLACTPAAWLGHALAATVYKALAPVQDA